MNAIDHPCNRLKELLVETGEFDRERHPGLAAHVSGCAACQRLLAAWNALPGLLDELPEHEPDEALVEKVRTAVNADATVRGGTARRRFLAPSLASAAILLAAVGISRELLMHEALEAPVPVASRGIDGYSLREPESTTGMQIGQGRLNDEVAALGKEKSGNRDLLQEVESEEESVHWRTDDAPAAELGDNRARASRLPAAKPPAPAEAPALKREADLAASREARQQASRAAEAKRDAHALDRAGMAQDKNVFEEGMLTAERTGEDASFFEADTVSDPKQVDADGKFGSDQNEYAGAGGEPAAPEPRAIGSADELSAIPAFDFLAYYQTTDGLAFQPATGYWANTHVPGDPAIRLLSARLAQWDRSWLAGDDGLERAVRPVPQPFDAPDNNALALSLMADVAGIPAGAANHGTATRFRLQVGIQGIEHRRGQRPAMNVGVVVDLPSDAPDAARIAARALLDALLESKRSGDRFSLVISGADAGDPGLVVAADEFRFGALQLAKDRILGRDGSGDGEPARRDPAVIDTYAALQRAGRMVMDAEEPGRPLGSSAVLLISARAPADLDRLTELTHQHAQDGITTSVFPLGGGLASDQAEQLVLAGLGNRRILEAPADARRLVEDELHASSRAVARAARLSIRLAPGVKLVDVIGSERLDEPRAQRVRDIENTLDRRLAADLGIQADRGQDEDGIQIVIPAIHSGDSATVLLDLVTDRPGAIAEVTLRYKDLVYLRNGALSAQLELPRVESGPAHERGPAETAVLKNLLAHHFSEAVTQAADALGRGDADHAARILRGMKATIGKARRDLPAWSDDADLIHDEQILDRYIAALDSPQAATHQSFLADSLRLAAFAKQHGLPEEWK